MKVDFKAVRERLSKFGKELKKINIAVYVDGPNILRKELGIDLKDVKKAIEQFGRIKIGKVFLNQYASNKLLEAVVNQGFETVEYLDRAGRVNGLLGMLEESERKIVELRFGFAGGVPQTLEEIGSAFGVTRERVRQIESKALGKLREAVKGSDIASLEAI